MKPASLPGQGGKERRVSFHSIILICGTSQNQLEIISVEGSGFAKYQVADYSK